MIFLLSDTEIINTEQIAQAELSNESGPVIRLCMVGEEQWKRISGPGALATWNRLREAISGCALPDAVLPQDKHHIL